MSSEQSEPKKTPFDEVCRQIGASIFEEAHAFQEKCMADGVLIKEMETNRGQHKNVSITMKFVYRKPGENSAIN